MTPGHLLKRAGWALIALAVALMVVSGVVIVVVAGPALLGSVTGPSSPIPGTVSTHLNAGRYVIFEQTGSQSQAGPISTTFSNGVTLTPDDVTITGPGGENVVPYVPSNEDASLDRNGVLFTGAVWFHVRSAGQYRIDIESESNSQVVIARDFGDALASVGNWFGLGFVGFLLLILGFFLLFLYARRRRRFAGRLGPPPGWYPNPLYPSQALWWNGQAWTAPTPYW